MTGAIMTLGGVAKLGFIADLISKPTMIGYMNGLALTILVGQLPKLFGFKVDAEGLIGEIDGFVKGLAHGEAVAAAAAVGITGIVLILVLQRWLPKLPAVLIMVVLAIAATTVFSLADHGVDLVGRFRRVPAAHHPARPPGRPRAPVRRGRRDHRGSPGRYDLHGIGVRRPYRAGDRRNGEMIGIGVANLAARFSRGSRSAPAGRAPGSPNGPARRPSSPGSPGPW